MVCEIHAHVKKEKNYQNKIRKWTKVQICVYKNKDFNQQKRKDNNIITKKKKVEEKWMELKSEVEYVECDENWEFKIMM